MAPDSTHTLLEVLWSPGLSESEHKGDQEYIREILIMLRLIILKFTHLHHNKPSNLFDL